MELIPGAVVGGKYELERALASGGMGSIWVARHTELNAKVAIKFISAAYAGSTVLRARFVREARAAAQIASSYVVHVHDYGVADDTPYLVMELLSGEDLGVRLKREKTLPLDVVARLFTQIAKGLRRAHKAGIVHRDLKPSNIFLSQTDDDEEVVKLLDFGVAKQLESDPLDDCTKTGEIMGSPHYMSPEQIHESKYIDARSDLWSLAVILFRAITGELPFPGDAAGLVMSKILTDPIPMPSQFVSGVPIAVDEFFRRAFQRDPAYRFPSAREMAEAFAEATGGDRTARVSWTFLGTTTAPWLTPSLPPPSVAPPSSTLPAMFALDGTLRSAEAEAPVSSKPSAPRIASALETRDTQPLHHTGTLTVAYRAVESSPPRARRPALAWVLSAAGVVGIVMGWILIGLFVHPAEGAVRPAQGAIVGSIAPLSPAFAVAAPTKLPSDAAQPVNDPASEMLTDASQLGAERPMNGQANQASAPASAAAEPTVRPSATAPSANPSPVGHSQAPRQARRTPRLGF